MPRPKPKWTLSKFFEQWYVQEATTTLSRKRPCQKTIDSRRIGVRYWSELMATKKRPEGPKLKEITQEHLKEFWDKLREATYQRSVSGKKYPLSESTRYGRFQDVTILLSAAGPESGKLIRAGVLGSVPSLYIPTPVHFAKDTWELCEIRQVVDAIDEFTVSSVEDLNDYRANLKAWIGLCYHTGHRATTHTRFGSDDLVQVRPGIWLLNIKRSVKTGKPARVPVHPHLLHLLQALPEGKPLIRFPFSYRTIFNHFEKLQRFAGLDESRIFSPQAFRRLHCQTLINMGVSQAQSVGSESLGHSSSDITTSHYGDAKSILIPTMPPIFNIPVDVKPRSNQVNEARQEYVAC